MISKPFAFPVSQWGLIDEKPVSNDAGREEYRVAIGEVIGFSYPYTEALQVLV